MNPEWIIAAAAIVSPVIAAVAAVFSVRGELRVVREIAISARSTAKQAHHRIDQVVHSGHGH